MRDQILKIFSSLETDFLTEEGVETIRVKGKGLYIAYICISDLTVGLWRGNEELDNSTCPTESMLIVWCHHTFKEIR